MPRFHCATPLTPGLLLNLPDGAARHVQVLRLQPGDDITLFNGVADSGGQFGEFAATVTQMGRSQVQVEVGAWTATAREASRDVHLAVGMPANERMDWLVEKASELGAASIQPLMTERSVLRLSGERAVKKQLHWQSVAVAACEQCGGNWVPVVHPMLTLQDWLKLRASNPALDALACLLSLQPTCTGLRQALAQHDAAPQSAFGNSASKPRSVTFLSGPEGGLSPAEEQVALSQGFQPVTLGARVLRAETAALAALATLLV
jgi:16S rRNA (uracil1498-N3)-methyltransferase